MRLNPRISFESRRRLDEHLRALRPFLAFFYRPRKGWIKAIREALGMSSRQLAKNLGKTNSEILALEKREEEDKITLQTLKRVASALNCSLVYALVPDADSLQTMVHTHAVVAAARTVKSTSNSMSLEGQGITDAITKAQIEDLAFELERRLDPRIWDQGKRW